MRDKDSTKLNVFNIPSLTSAAGWPSLSRWCSFENSALKYRAAFSPFRRNSSGWVWNTSKRSISKGVVIITFSVEYVFVKRNQQKAAKKDYRQGGGGLALLLVGMVTVFFVLCCSREKRKGILGITGMMTDWR